MCIVVEFGVEQVIKFKRRITMEQLRLSKRRIHYLGLGGIVLVIYLQLTIVNAAVAESKFVKVVLINL